MPDSYDKIPIKIFGSGVQNRVYDDQDEQTVATVIRTQILPAKSAEYQKVNVKIKRNMEGKPTHMLAYLLRKDTYTAEVSRIDVDENFQVTDIKEDYDDSQDFNEEDAYEWESDDTAAYTYDLVVATPCDDITTAVNAVNLIATMAHDMGLKTKKLIGSEATVANYRNFLTSGLKGFINIGHGNPNCIVLDDGLLASSWFQGLTNHPLAPAVVYFNSCQVHNPPLETAIMNAGARTFIGGNVNLLIGASEEVCKCFWNKTLLGMKAMGQSLSTCEQAHYPTTGAHGITGDQGILTLGRSIALRAVNDKFVCAEEGGKKSLVANRNWIRSWETFEMIDLGSNKVALRAVNGKYVCAEGGGGRELIANRNWIRSWETFTLVKKGGNQVGLKACNGQFVRAENAGRGPLMANSNHMESWETFDLISLKLIGLRAGNQKYVCALKGGGDKLVADRPWLRSWETFVLTDLGNDRVALRAKKGQYVCAEEGGKKHLMANRPWIRSWETFEMEDLGHQVAFKACNGLYVRHRGTNDLKADRKQRTKEVTFEMIEVGPNFNWIWDHLEQMEQIELVAVTESIPRTDTEITEEETETETTETTVRT